MLQALINHKLGHAISTGRFSPTEDSLTSSVIGTLQYLPDTLFWNLIRKSCGSSLRYLPKDVGHIIEFHFWEKLDPEGTSRVNFVEPDVWIETEKFNIIIEAKKSDYIYDNYQDEVQWHDEIMSVKNSTQAPKLIFIALGGNKDLYDSSILVENQQIRIHTASWFNLLDAVENAFKKYESNAEESHVTRILSDTIEAFALHHILSTKWLKNLQCTDSIKLENLDAIWQPWK